MHAISPSYGHTLFFCLIDKKLNSAYLINKKDLNKNVTPHYGLCTCVCLCYPRSPQDIYTSVLSFRDLNKPFNNLKLSFNILDIEFAFSGVP